MQNTIIEQIQCPIIREITQKLLSVPHPHNYLDHIELDMFELILKVSTLEQSFLVLHTNIINMRVDLIIIIKNAIQKNEPKYISLLLEKQMPLYEIDPSILIRIIESNLPSFDSILYSMLMNSYPLSPESIYKLCKKNKHQHLKLIFDKYPCFPNQFEIISICSVISIKESHLETLQIIIPIESFSAIRDFIFVILVNSIRTNASIEIIKYLTSSKFISIYQEDKLPIKMAINNNRAQILRYFCLLHPDIIDELTHEQKKKFNLIKFPLESRTLKSASTVCNILHTEISPKEKYFLCENKSHVFNADAWISWMDVRNDWICPLCFSPVLKIMFEN